MTKWAVVVGKLMDHSSSSLVFFLLFAEGAGRSHNLYGADA